MTGFGRRGRARHSIGPGFAYARVVDLILEVIGLILEIIALFA